MEGSHFISDAQYPVLIPMYGARHRVSNLYELASDGNWQSMLYAFNKHGKDCELCLPAIELLTPSSFTYLSLFMNTLSINVHLIHCDFYDINPGITRMSDKWNDFKYEWHKTYFTAIPRQAYNGYGKGYSIVYMAYAIATKNYKPDYFLQHAKLDELLVGLMPVLVATPNQQARLKGSYLFNDYFDSIAYTKLILGAKYCRVDEAKSIFYHFRQTHDGYNIQNASILLEKLQERTGLPLIVTAPNGVNVLKNAKTVSPDKVTYWNYLNAEPIILCLAPHDDSYHFSMFEHGYFGCYNIGLKNGVCEHELEGQDFDELYEKISQL